MHIVNIKRVVYLFSILVLSLTGTSCSKSNNGSGPSNTGVHKVDPSLVGKWMWTQASDGAYYDDYGTYNGAASGLALEYTINADGTGTAYNHLYSSIGPGTRFEVNISYQGFFESDNEGHLGFFPLSGTYKTSQGVNRALRADELWDVNKKSGRSFLYQQVTVTTQGQRVCFQTTAGDGTVDTYFKL